MSFYEDLKKSLQEAIDIEKGNISLKQVENMPAPTYVAADKQKEE